MMLTRLIIILKMKNPFIMVQRMREVNQTEEEPYSGLAQWYDLKATL